MCWGIAESTANGSFWCHQVLLVVGCTVIGGRLGPSRKFTTYASFWRSICNVMMLVHDRVDLADHNMDRWFARRKSGCACSFRSHFAHHSLKGFGSDNSLDSVSSNIFAFRDFFLNHLHLYAPSPLHSPWTPFLFRLLLRTLILIRQPLRHAANRPIRIEVFPDHAVFI